MPIETSIRTKRIVGDHQIQRGSLSSAEEEKKYSKSNNPYYINTAVSTTTGKIDMKKYQESMIGSNEIISNKTNTPLGKVINGGQFRKNRMMKMQNGGQKSQISDHAQE